MCTLGKQTRTLANMYTPPPPPHTHTHTCAHTCMPTHTEIFNVSPWSQAQELKAKFGEVSILVNNAGVVISSTILAAGHDDIEHTFRVNTMAQIWVSQTHCFNGGIKTASDLPIFWWCWIMEVRESVTGFCCELFFTRSQPVWLYGAMFSIPVLLSSSVSSLCLPPFLSYA